MSNIVKHEQNEVTAPQVGSSGFEVANWIMHQMAPLLQISERFAKCGLVPPALAGKPEAVFKVLMRGLELGIPMATALDTIHVINGRVALSADDMAGLAMRAGVSFKYDSTPERCVIEWKRGESSGSTSFSVKDAANAGLTGNPTWKKYPAAMCAARAKAAASRMAAPDMLAGVYTPDEVKSIAKVADYDVVSDEPTNGVAVDEPDPPVDPRASVVFDALNSLSPEDRSAAIQSAKTKTNRPKPVAKDVDPEAARVLTALTALTALMALTTEMGIQDKLVIEGEKRTVLLMMDDEIKGAARMAGCNQKITPSLFGGADFIVVRELSTEERTSLGKHLRKLHNVRRAKTYEARDAEDAAEMMGTESK